jgi:hypothetical protein
VTKIARSLAVGLSAALLVLIAAAPALADGEPPTPLSSSATSLVITGIVVAAIAAAAWLALFRIARARRAAKTPARGANEGPS